jgi:hypothetical protein
MQMALSFDLLKQSRNTNCGQTAVAMLTRRPVKEINKLFGTCATSNMVMVASALTSLHYVLGSQQVSPEGARAEDLPALAMVRLAFRKRSGGHVSAGKVKNCGHVVLIANGMVFDPVGRKYPVNEISTGSIIERFIPILAVPQCRLDKL